MNIFDLFNVSINMPIDDEPSDEDLQKIEEALENELGSDELEQVEEDNQEILEEQDK
jgi:hypothetical protein